MDADLALGGELGGVRAGAPRDLGPAEWGWANGFDRRGWERALELLEGNPGYSGLMGGYLRRWGAEDGAAADGDALVEPAAWRRSAECQEVYGTIGVEHSLWCLRSVPGAAGDVFGGFLCRAAGRPNFSARDAAVAAAGYALLAPLVGGPLARALDPSPAALPPRTRQVLRCLLQGDSDKQVGARLGLTPLTVNGHTKRIYRHFGVVTRAELLARWVRRGWGGRAAWADGPA